MWQERLEMFRGRVSEEVLREGVQAYKDHRVKEVEVCGKHLVGFVEMESAFDVTKTEVRVYADGHVGASCSCGGPERLCAHAIATVLAAPEGVAGIDPNQRREDALAAVRRAGRREVFADPITADENGYGVWRAQMMAKHRPNSAIHRVEIYSLNVRANQCTCREFEFDQLGTCRHIEAVLHRLACDDDGNSPRSVVYVDWTAHGPRLRVHWSAGHREEPPAAVARWLGDDGVLDVEPERVEELLCEKPRRVRGVDLGSGVRHLLARRREAVERETRPGAVADYMLRKGSTGHFRGLLQPFQRDGVRFLVRTGRALLADDMGLGKTVQAIAAADWMLERGEVERVLVVCPASVKVQWKREIERFTDRKAVVVEGDFERRMSLYREGGEFLIANYEIVRSDAPSVRRNYAVDLLVVDEAQRIKNRDTLTAEAVKSLRAKYCFGLTGTPIENRASDLHSIMELIDPTVLGPYWQFDSGDVVGTRLAVQPRILRRRRAILAEQLPARRDERRVVRITKEQLGYQQLKVSAASIIMAEAERQGRKMTPGEKALVMSFLTSARMASNGMFLIDGETMECPKLDELTRVIDELRGEGRKVVVFSEWVRMIAFVRERLNARGVGSLFLHGGVPSSRRSDLIDQFAESPDIHVFFSTEAGGVGLNLQCASAVVNLELPWNPAKLEQRAARVHRLGQARDVRVIDIVGTGYELSAIGDKLARKQEIADSILEAKPVVRRRRGRTARELGYSALKEVDEAG